MAIDLFNPFDQDTTLLDTVDAKGDLLVGQSDAVVDNLGVGTNGQVLVADSAEPLGVKWATPEVTSNELELRALQEDLDAHIDDTTDAHNASAISINDAAGDFDATDVEGALAELQADAEADAAALAAHLADGADAHDASAISLLDTAGQYTATDVEAALEEVHDLVDAHLVDAADAHDASAISVVDAGGYITGTDVEAALQELGAAAGGLAAHLADGADAHDASAISVADVAGQLAATDVEAALAEIQDNLDAHLADAADAHDASAISILDAANDFTATDVEGALAELQSDAEADATALSDHIADGTAAHAASAISADSTTLVGVGTDVQAVLEELDNAIADHLADAADAHDASAVSVAPSGNLAADDVQEALLELQDDIDGITLGGTTPSGSAGGVLDGTYPNPGLAAAVAGDGLAETTNVLSVNVDGTTIEINSDALRVKDAGITTAKLHRHEVQILVSDPNGSAITTGDGKAYFLVPARFNGLNLVGIYGSVSTVSSSGIPTVQIRNETQTADMLTTKLTIDASEKTSFSATNAAVIDTANDDVATGDILWVDIDVAGTGAKGLIVGLIFGL